ncbi:autoinducer 2 ABC transporter substrate-binding protein [Diplocloster modestus]|uniref:Autoinducer 2 ABC transporter substrate-binding protein n=1 Tax=Diplocloster modestus TaxID=2850322 RepID=A0ABS6KA19_9FIRM|nr:autoinducer 2 ABC transporter substrate-binding protein [Diplocloster modestus]MBU9727351.1 autoinducer 2 ABC transporter substrate-binding protein [Diplocloster modestus]
MKKGIALLLVMGMCAGLLSGCGKGVSSGEAVSGTEAQVSEKQGNDSGATKDSNGYTIALIPQQVGIPYFETSGTWGQKAAEDLGCEVIYTGPTTGDAASQANIVQDMITKGVDCIAISPLDASAIEPVLEQAKEAGILVVTWDSDVNKTELREVYVNCCSEQVLGEHLMERFAHYMGGKGDYAIITSVLTAQNCSAWAKYATEYQEANYPDMTRVAYEPCDDDQSKAYSITQNLMTAYPELKGVLGVTTPAPPAAAQAVGEAGKNGDVIVTGVVEASAAKSYLEDGSMQEANIWHPGKLGYLAVYTAKTLLDGGKIEDGQDVPEVGAVEVKDDQIIMTELLDITTENVDEFDF